MKRETVLEVPRIAASKNVGKDKRVVPHLTTLKKKQCQNSGWFTSDATVIQLNVFCLDVNICDVENCTGESTKICAKKMNCSDKPYPKIGSLIEDRHKVSAKKTSHEESATRFLLCICG